MLEGGEESSPAFACHRAPRYLILCGACHRNVILKPLLYLHLHLSTSNTANSLPLSTSSILISFLLTVSHPVIPLLCSLVQFLCPLREMQALTQLQWCVKKPIIMFGIWIWGLGVSVLRQQKKINSHLGIAFSNIIVMILDNYSLIVKTTLILSLWFLEWFLVKTCWN